MVEHYSLPWPAIDRNSFWTHQSAFAIAYYATPLLYLVSAALAGWRLSRHSSSSLDLAVLIVAVSGLGLFPQAMSRVDVHHYLQVTAPLLVLLGILLGAPATGIARRAQRVGAAGLFGLLLIGVAPEGAFDMASPWRNPVVYWRELANLPASRPDDAMGAIAIRLRQFVPPGRPIFFATAWSLSGVLVASERPMAGAIPAYAPGVVDHPRWKVLNLKALREYPPQALVVYGPAWDAGLASEIAPYDPSLIREWRERFTSVAYDQGNWRILLAP